MEAVSARKGWQPVSSIYWIKLPESAVRGTYHLWIRGTCQLAEPERYAAISAGKTRDFDTVYVNGRMVGKKTYTRPIEWHQPSLYALPPGVLKKGTNTVYIRLGVHRRVLAAVKPGRVELLSPGEYRERVFWNDVWYRQVFAWMLAVFTAMVLVHLIQFLVDRRDKMLLVIALGFLLYDAILIPLFALDTGMDITRLGTVYSALVPVSIIFTIAALQTIYGIYLSAKNRVIMPIMLGFSLLICTDGHLLQDAGYRPLLTVASMAVGFAWIGFMLRELHSIRLTRFKIWSIVVSTAYNVVILLLDVLAPVIEFRCPDLMSVYLMPVGMLQFVLYEAIESRKRRMKLEGVYSSFPAAGTHKKERAMLTENSEEKLSRVVTFIEENYTEDISREGLAAAVDLNPNYLSSLFNAYTGKKLNEFINALRVRDAAGRLADPDARIVEVAYAVGFESLSTFSRAFKNETGCTPTEYRRALRDR